uniref:Cysteine-rich and transmembrane domain-containing protein 1 n=1 Tax=Podarcis muralis TaxID=64176 RepID=A0A670KBQ9_PODMU
QPPQQAGAHPSSQSYAGYPPGPYPSAYSTYPAYAPPYGYQGYQAYPAPLPSGLVYGPGPGHPVYIIEERKEPSTLATCLAACWATLCCCCVWDILTAPRLP